MSSSKLLTKLTLLTFVLFSFSIVAQDTEEVTVVGTQIKGASISSALPVSVYSIDDIEALGIDSGDELLDSLVEQGQNEFAEASETAGINSSRGDMGAYNLRNISAGNTLVLLNGRRLVNSPGYQTELIGGGFTPVSSVNSNLIPTGNLDRVEVLRDGASAIYGADAVAGVVNNVVDSNFDGFVYKLRKKDFDSFEGTQDESVSFKYGTDIGNGNVTVSYDFVSKGHARARDHEVMSIADLRTLLPGGTSDPHASFFNNTSSQSIYGQFDVKENDTRLSKNNNGGPRFYISESDGEFLTLPDNDARCATPKTGSNSATVAFKTGFGTCLVSNDNYSVERWNKNTYAWVRGETNRNNLLISFNQDIGTTTFYNELGWYNSNYYSERDLSTQYPQKLRIGANSYYNPMRQQTAAQIATSTANPTAGGTSWVGTNSPFESDAELFIDNYRFGHLPRTVDVEKDTWRFLQGVSGSLGNWDFDGALVVSQATSKDTAGNQIDFEKMQIALFDSTAAGYNFLCDWTRVDCSTNIEQTLVDVEKIQESRLSMIDLKFTNDALFELPAGPVGFLIGLETRKESYKDDRSPYLDGTILFKQMTQSSSVSTSNSASSTAQCFRDSGGATLSSSNGTGAMLLTSEGKIDTTHNNTACFPAQYQYPYSAAVMGGSPTDDSDGERDTDSLFTEFSIPVLDNLDMQVAARYESTSDFGDEVVGKFAIGWDATNTLLIRASASTTFKAPNLVAMNQAQMNRRNSGQIDYTSGIIKDSSSYNSEWIQRQTEKNANLQAETSKNFSVGFVYEPFANFTIIADAYRIEKDETIGNFGTTNEIALDFLKRWQARGRTTSTDGTSAFETAAESVTRCSAQAATNYNANVLRGEIDADDYDDMSVLAKHYGLCPVAGVSVVKSNYLNLADRTLEGFDLSMYYNLDTDLGSFDFRYRGAFTSKLEQSASPGTSAETLINAINSGVLSDAITKLSAGDNVGAVVAQGYGSLEGKDSIFEEKHSLRVSYRKNNISANLTAKHIGDYVQSAIVDSNGIPFTVDSFTTANLSLAYRFDLGDARVKATFGVNNIEDKTAPLADQTFGYDADVHNGYGRSIYFDLRASF
ncbi:MAG: TonB-dependent receptor [Gammaproteobacteria bacterium]